MLTETILRLPGVVAATGLSRSTIYDRIHHGTFPAPISIGGDRVGWPVSKVRAWIDRAVDGSADTRKREKPVKPAAVVRPAFVLTPPGPESTRRRSRNFVRRQPISAVPPSVPLQQKMQFD